MTPVQAAIAKEAAADYAVAKFVKPGMRLGLGSGTTAAFAVHALARRIANESLQLSSIISTSIGTAELAGSLGIEVSNELTLDKTPLDLTLDGADELDYGFNLIKGGGGALMREKLVAIASKQEVILVDESKVAKELGHIHPLPVMIVPYGWQLTKVSIEKACGRSSKLRTNADGSVFISDDGLYCLDVERGAITSPRALDVEIDAITGVVESGLFIGLAQNVVVGYIDGSAHELHATS